MKEIILTQGKVALVDDEDFERVNQLKWYAGRHGHTFYARRSIGRNGIQKNQLMHRFITDEPLNKEVDHRDRNGLNNKRDNLRICTHSQNMANSGLKKINTSGFKGVSFYKPTQQWRARSYLIKKSGKKEFIGYFDTAELAARAYDAAVIASAGEFALTNQKLGLLV